MRSIEEVIEELNKELFSIGEQVGEEIKSGKINDTPYSRGMLQGIAMVAVCVENRGNEILEIHKAEQQKKWIPVSERLPEEGRKIYLTCFQDGYMATIMMGSDGKWLIEGEEPIAWMPLPEPYKAESEDK